MTVDHQPSFEPKPHAQRAGSENAGHVPVNAALTEPDSVRQSPDAGGSASAHPARFDGGEMASDARSRVAPGEVHRPRPGSVSVDAVLLAKVAAILARETTQ